MMIHYKNFNLQNYTCFKIGGTAKNAYFPETIDEFVELLKNSNNPIVLGGMSNVLVSSIGIEQDVILTKKLNKFEVQGNKIYAQCGAMGPLVSRCATEAGLSGMEFMCGFPGSIGGIVCMNAGAHNQSISEIFAEATVFDKQNKCVLTFTNEDMNFEYRTSKIQNGNYIVLDAKFTLKHKQKDEILSKIQANNKFRKEKQPNLSTPNCGSVFKNPKNDSAGRLLDAVGAKNFSAGGAKVFENHANFIVNFNNATSLDVSQLMKKMYNEVKEKFSVKLTPEVKFIGKMNKEEEEIWNELLNH